MNAKVRIALSTLLMVLCASVAYGQDWSSYGGVRLGASLLETTDLDFIKVDLAPGFMILGSLGYRLDGGRLEAEVGYRENSIDKIVFRRKGNSFDPGGNFSAWSFMFNSIADFKTATDFTPYLIVGGGATLISLKKDLSLGVEVSDADEWFFAYQGGIGVGYALTLALTLDIKYRYFSALRTKFETTSGDKVDFDYRSHNATLGLRYAF